jgi:diaminohydroxyphosphoribosylaminopyrimidine deaminase/5-amino-6-(5-phosphoribosylamino)uracil reductase
VVTFTKQQDANANADAAYMRRALALAERGRGGTTPNPLVGALIVSPDGEIVGRGFHAKAGTPHAEIHALRDAGDRARGATLYCTLEPCSHTGRTGPCAAAIEQAGIARVVAAIEDPNPLVAGGGFRHLEAHGIAVTSGVLRAEAAKQNEVFITNIRAQRPFVTLKVAMSLDGRIAAARGARTALTSADANRHAHRFRAEVDAMAIGSETLIVDDPLLTARDVYRARPLTRIVFDGRLRTPPTAQLFTTRDAGPILIVCDSVAVAAHPERAEALERAGAELLATHSHDIVHVMGQLWKREIASVLLEGGAALHAAAWQAGVVDRVRMYVTPDALGDAGVQWNMPASFDVAQLHDRRAEPLGRDTLLEGYVHRID